jgi:hypothetical protein
MEWITLEKIKIKKLNIYIYIFFFSGKNFTYETNNGKYWKMFFGIFFFKNGTKHSKIFSFSIFGNYFIENILRRNKQTLNEKSKN